MSEPISRRKLFGWLGAGSVAAVTKVLPAAEKAAPKIWDTMLKAGRLHYWDGMKWVKAWSNKYLVGP